MARTSLTVKSHLNEKTLRDRYRACHQGAERSRWQVIWLLNRTTEPLSVKEVAAIVGFSEDWIRKLVRRYNEVGPAALANRYVSRPRGRQAMLSTDLQMALQQLLQEPSTFDGSWSGPKVAQWIESATGKKVSAVTGWQYLRKLAPPHHSSFRKRVNVETA